MSGTGTMPEPAAALEPEDRWRANLYGLIGRLYYGAPDPSLLSQIARDVGGGSVGDGTALLASWRVLQQACRSASPAEIRQEYDSLFVGVGKSEVTPYLSAYSRSSAPDRYLVGLRERLAGWGLARRAEAAEVEDHVSGIADVMRWLIQEGRPVREQRLFFQEFVYGEIALFCAALQNAVSANFYKPVGRFTAAFFEVEKAAFDMSEEG